MVSALIYLLVFVAGLITCDLIRIAQERFRLYQVTRLMARMGAPLEATVRKWSADPHNMCDRPGCPRCWGGWGNS